MVADSRQAVLKRLERFQQVFSAIVIATIALAFLLAVNQIRRQMRPLELLTESTRRLASGDLGATVQDAGEDEFGSLAHAFNQMSGNLRYKFHMLQMLAELDRRFSVPPGWTPWSSWCWAISARPSPATVPASSALARMTRERSWSPLARQARRSVQ